MELDKLFMLQNEMDSAIFDQQLGIKHNPKKRSSPFKIPSEDGRIFSNYFTNLIVSENNERVIQPMRYRVRPMGSREEIPTKFNVFNARLDSLELRQTWIPLFMQKHAIIPLNSFYEWVEGPLKKTKLIRFYPDKYEIMWAPCLYDEWISKDGTIHFKSFAIITHEPPPEILAMGHDRCPIFLKEENIDRWLNPKNKKSEIYKLLTDQTKTEYKYEWL